MQNNHVVPSIELLAKSLNFTQYITVVIRLHLLMQNNHAVPSIELLWLHFLMYKYKHANSMHIQSWLFCIKNGAQ